MFIPTLRLILEKTEIPEISSPHAVTHRFLLVASHITRALTTGVPPNPRSLALGTAVATLTSILCDWTITFYSKFVLESFPDDDRPLIDYLKDNMMLTLNWISQLEPVYEKISAHGGIVDSLSRVWSLAVTENGPLQVLDNYFILLRRLVFTKREPHDLSHWKDFYLALDVLPLPVIILSLLNRIISDLQAVPIPVADIEKYLAMLSCPALVLPKFVRELMAAHTVKWCWVVMRRLTSSKRVLPPGCEQNVRGCMNHTYILMTKAFKDGWWWGVETLQSGAVECLFQCQSLMDHDAQNEAGKQGSRTLTETLAEIMNTLNALTMYRPVLKEAHTVVKKVLWRNLEDGIKQEGALWDAWIAFKDIVHERWDAREDFAFPDEAFLCNNPKVRFSQVNHW